MRNNGYKCTNYFFIINPKDALRFRCAGSTLLPILSYITRSFIPSISQLKRTENSQLKESNSDNDNDIMVINLLKTFSTLHICFPVNIKMHLNVTYWSYRIVIVYVLRES